MERGRTGSDVSIYSGGSDSVTLDVSTSINSLTLGGTTDDLADIPQKQKHRNGQWQKHETRIRADVLGCILLRSGRVGIPSYMVSL